MFPEDEKLLFVYTLQHMSPQFYSIQKSIKFSHYFSVRSRGQNRGNKGTPAHIVFIRCLDETHMENQKGPLSVPPAAAPGAAPGLRAHPLSPTEGVCPRPGRRGGGEAGRRRDAARANSSGLLFPYPRCLRRVCLLWAAGVGVWPKDRLTACGYLGPLSEYWGNLEQGAPAVHGAPRNLSSPPRLTSPLPKSPRASGARRTRPAGFGLLLAWDGRSGARLPWLPPPRAGQRREAVPRSPGSTLECL